MDTVVVHKCMNDIEAEQIRDLLRQEGIECQMASSIPHSVFPLTTDGLGEIRISVLQKDKIRAEELIRDFLEASDHDSTDSMPPGEDDDA